ncbi:MAG: hypothetical protein HY763_03155 [Planctomycetes bacterium]|nr:hypothetical protein [Planctomycetota bacterium]
MIVIRKDLRVDKFLAGYITAICAVNLGVGLLMTNNHRKAFYWTPAFTTWFAVAALVIMLGAVLSVRRTNRWIGAQPPRPDVATSRLRPKWYWGVGRTFAHIRSLGITDPVLIVVGALPTSLDLAFRPPILLPPLEFCPGRNTAGVTVFTMATWGAWYAIPYIDTPNREMMIYRSALLVLACALTGVLLVAFCLSERTQVRVWPGVLEVTRHGLLCKRSRTLRYDMSAPGAQAIVSCFPSIREGGGWIRGLRPGVTVEAPGLPRLNLRLRGVGGQQVIERLLGRPSEDRV